MHQVSLQQIQAPSRGVQRGEHLAIALCPIPATWHASVAVREHLHLESAFMPGSMSGSHGLALESWLIWCSGRLQSHSTLARLGLCG